MEQANATFQVGDRVVHWAYGPGVIMEMDEKEISGITERYYILQVRDLTMWVPVTDAGERGLRFPTPPEEFPALYLTLSGAADSLSDDRLERKNQLAERLKGNTLDEVCRVVRDLTNHKRTKKMNDNDNAVLLRARTFLLNEWSVSLSVSLNQAEQELDRLLGEEESKPISK